MRKYKTIKVDEYERMLKEISSSNEIDLDSFDLLIYGGGGQDKNYYKRLRDNTNCEILWTGWAGPKWTKFLSFIPGQAGLLKIKQQNVFADLYYELASYSVSDAIYISKDFTELIKNEVNEKTWKMNFESFLERASNSFILTSETDETISEKGHEMYFYDYFFGSELNQELKDIIERKSKNEHTT